MRSVAVRFLLPVGAITLLLFVLVVYWTYRESRRHAEELVRQQAALATGFELAIRDYAATQIRPVMECLLDKDRFIPETMSTSFIARSIFEEVRKTFPEYIVRFASVQPRNPVNRANPDEAAMIAFFREHPGTGTRTEEIEIDGRRYVAQFTPKWMKSECLHCHGDPKDAPAELVKRYGATASFHRKVGDVAGLDTIAIPVDTVNAALSADFRRMFLFLVAGGVVLLGAVLITFRWVVARRLNAMAAHFERISEHPEAVTLTPLEVRGKDEIAVVGIAFNRLVEQLLSVYASLESRVSERTADLLRMNEELLRENAERRRAEKILEESEARYRLISENTEDVIWLFDLEENRFTYVSPSVERLRGFSVAEVQTQTLREALEENSHRLVMESLPARIAAVEAGVLSPRAAAAEVEQTCKDGSTVSTEAVTTMLMNEAGKVTGILGITRDISERKRAEQALRASEEKYRRLHASMMDAFVSVDMNGRLQEFNAAYSAMLGYSEEELHLLTYEDLTPSKWHAMEAEIVREQVLRRGHSGVYEKEYRRKDGTVFPVELRTSLLRDDSGTPMAMWAIIRDVTERKRAAEALAESEERFHSLFESMTEGVALHELTYGPDGRPVDYRVIDANPAFERHTGIPVTQARGKLATELYGTGIAPFMETYVRVALEGTRETMEPSFPAMGKDFHISVFSPRRGWFATVFQDITDRKQVEEQLQRSARAVEDLYNNAPCGYHSLDMNGVFLIVNDTELRWLDCAREELVGKKRFVDMVTAESRDAFEGNLPQLVESGRISDLELEMRRKDGSLFPVLLSMTLLRDAEGVPVSSRSMVFDMTERKRAEAERKNLEAQVQQAQKLESLGVLAGGIAHDFNNLLMAIMGNADLALQDISEVSPARPMLEEIDKTAHRAAELCKQMLAYSGKGRLVIKPIDLSELVKEMGHMLAVSISKKAVLNYNLAERLPSVEVDPTQIRQVIMNLIINASESIGEENGVISVSTGIMNCTQQYLLATQLHDKAQEGEYVFVEVADSGCGMDAGTIEKIFDPFFTTKFTGRGLGLAAVLGIVRGHQGALKVDSEPGKGTVFRVLLPALSYRAEVVPLEPPVHRGWKSWGTILLVDDEETIRSLCQRMLERLGFNVLTAGDGADAIEVFRAHAGEIRCVLLDLTMPRMDGKEAFGEMRRIDPGARVVMSSGYDEQEVASQFSSQGLAGFIQKPYRVTSLKAVLREVLGE